MNKQTLARQYRARREECRGQRYEPNCTKTTHGQVRAQSRSRMAHVKAKEVGNAPGAKPPRAGSAPRSRSPDRVRPPRDGEAVQPGTKDDGEQQKTVESGTAAGLGDWCRGM